MIPLFLTLFPFLSMAAPASPDTTDLPYYPDEVQFVTVEGRDIAFVDDGGEEPVLLFVHGLGSNLSIWRENLDAFRETHRVVALDLPGFGRSDKANVPATMPFFADAVAAFLDARDIDRVTYVGVSMGGHVGFTFALRHPDRVDRMALVSPAGIEAFTSQEAATLKTMMTPEAIASTPPARVEQNTALNFHTWSDDYAWIIEQRDSMAQRSDFRSYAIANANAVAGMLDGPVLDRLDSIDVPLLILYGAGDRLIPNPFLHADQTTASVAEAAREALPHADVQLVDEAGHLLMIERPSVFHENLRAFLNE